MKRTLMITAIAALSLLPLLASAQNLPSVWSPSSIKGPLVACSGNLYNVDGSVNQYACVNLCQLVFTVVSDIYVVIAFVIWIILPISFIIGGIMYMLSGANPGLLTTAKSTLKGAVIGVIIVISAYLLVATFVKFMQIGSIGGFSPGTPSVCTIP